MSTNALGEFQFISFSRPDDNGAAPPILTMRTEPVQRPGVTGTGLILHGYQSEPFQMRSAVDASSVGAGLDVYSRYCDLIGAGKQRLIWGSINYRVGYGTDYLVLAVDIIRCRKLASSVGGLNGGVAWLEALWTLIPVAK